MSKYDAALSRLKLRIGAESAATTPSPRELGRQAVEKFLAVTNHEPWLFWALKSDGTTVAKAGDYEKDVADPFGYLGMASTPYGDLSKVAYAAYWDVTKNPITPGDEYIGELTVSAKPDAPKAPPAPKKGSRLGWILGGIAGMVGVVIATKKKG